MLACLPIPEVPRQRRIFPSFVHQRTEDIRAQQCPVVGDGLIEVYGPELSAMGPERRREFLAGRRCAHAAIARCAPEHAAARIAIADGRGPVWPEGLVGAITHTGTRASAVVARSRDVRGLGLDLERRMTPEEAREVLPVVATPGEIGLVRDALAIDRTAAVTLVFSAKESVYKCLFPLVRRFFDYREADVVSVDRERRSCTVRVGLDLGAGVRAGEALEVKFAIDASHIETGVLLPWLLE